MNKQEYNKQFKKLENIIKNLTSFCENTNTEDLQKILQQINQLLTYSPDNIKLLTWKGVYYESIKDYDNAISVYEKILQLDENNKTVKKSIQKCIIRKMIRY